MGMTFLKIQATSYCYRIFYVWQSNSIHDIQWALPLRRNSWLLLWQWESWWPQIILVHFPSICTCAFSAFCFNQDACLTFAWC